MESNRLVKDKSKLYVSENGHYGITTSENIQKDLWDKYFKNMSFNAEYLLHALEGMKHLNDGSLEGVEVLLPKEPHPLIINNGIQCYLIAPLM